MRRSTSGLAIATAFSLSALCLVLAIPQTAHAQKNATVSPLPASTSTTTASRILFGGIPLPSTAEASPFRDPLDGALCITPESLAPLGTAYIVDEKMGKVTFALMEGGTSVTVDIRQSPAGVKGVFVPAVEVIEGLGGKCEWDMATGTLYAHSVLTGVEVLGGQLRIKATLPVKVVISRDNGGRKLIVDVPGAQVGALPKNLTLNAPNVSAARSGQFQADTARVVLEFKDAVNFVPLSDKPTALLVLNPTAIRLEERIAAAPAPRPVASPTKTSGKGKAVAQPTVISGVTFRRVSDTRAQFVISAGRSPATQAALERGKLTLSMLNSTLGADAGASLAKADHPLLKAAQIVASGNSVSRLVLDLTRVVSYGVMLGKDGTITLDIGLPRSAGGKLSGKLICVDPGHGYQDAGAPGVNGTHEKNVNLAIATQLAELLRDAGANVMMTRNSDTFLPVNERPRVANQAGADFFLSVHSDSTDGSHSVNGSTVYYHGYDPYCRALAQCIAERLEGMGGIRTKGVKSDYSVYNGEGFGVLRNSRMVAVLVECGYMTNASDVRWLNDPAMQRKIAESIAGGLRDYIEGNPDVDTRTTNPNVPAPPTPGDIMGTTATPAVEKPSEIPPPENPTLEAMPGTGNIRP